MGSMPGITIQTTRGVPPDAGTTNATTSPMVGSSGRTTAGTGDGNVGAENAAPDAEDSEAPQNNPDRAPSPIPHPPVSPITPTHESARISGSGSGSGSGHGDHHHHQHHRHASTSTSSRSPFSSNNTRENNDIPIFAQGRPTFTHSQPDQIGIPPPLPQPIAFDDNPDVLALKSAITILQLQRQRATADIQALNRAKNAALSDPGAFVTDLAAGRIGMDGDPLMNGPGAGDYHSDSEEEEDDDEDEDEDDEDQKDKKMKSEEDEDESSNEAEAFSSTSPNSHDVDGDIPMTNTNTNSSTSTPTHNSTDTNNHTTTKRNKQPPRRRSRINKHLEPAWRTLPKPQTVVRCPPINWAQYAVVGESLDKLHREQLRAPTLGQPAVFGGGGSHSAGSGSGGVYEFRGTSGTSGTASGTATTVGAAGGGLPGGSGDATATDRTSSSATPPTMNMAEGYVNAIGDTHTQGQGQGQIPRHQQQQQLQRLVGIAAPYTPGSDHIHRTTGRKGSSKR